MKLLIIYIHFQFYYFCVVIITVDYYY